MEPEVELGLVIGLRGEYAEVEMQSGDACHECGARVICRPNASGKRILYIRNTLNAGIGDSVFIEQSGANQLRLASMQYGLPMISFLVGLFTGNLILPVTFLHVPKDIASFLLGLLFLIFSGFITYAWTRRKAADRFYVFRMTEFRRRKND